MLLVQVLILLTFVKPSSSLLGPSLLTCLSHQRTSLKNSMTSSWLISGHPAVKSSVRCSIICLQEPRCVSFLYNDVMHDCRLFAVVKAVADMTSVSVGYGYYDTCRARGYYGASCSVNGDCKLTHTRCFQARCRCQEGYSFDPTSAECIAHCSSYGPEFEMIPDYFIAYNNEELISDLDTEACLEVCRQATDYVCRAADMRLSPDRTCSTSSVTKLDVPSDWMYQDTWVTVHYQRHCSL